MAVVNQVETGWKDERYEYFCWNKGHYVHAIKFSELFNKLMKNGVRQIQNVIQLITSQ